MPERAVVLDSPGCSTEHRDVTHRAVLPRTVRLIVAALGLLAAPLAVEAQQTEKVARIGILRQGPPPDPLVEAFRQGLRELGYVEGRNIRIEYRWAEGRADRLPDLAADLVRLKVDVIVAGGSDALAAKLATPAIPIVMPTSIDPVKLGLVASLPRPGGNVTGLASLWDEMPGKWMELLGEALPGVWRVAILQDPGTAASPSQVKASEAAARSLNVRLQVLNAGRPDDLATAFAEAARNRAEALIVLPSPFLFGYRTRVVELAARYRLPAMYHQREYVVGSGGLISYGPDLHDLFRRAAGYVDKILKGAKPADLPVEQPTKFELVINLKAARALGLSIPQSLLGRADQLIQ
jgi:putative ABC transport system substrate-binding protein